MKVSSEVQFIAGRASTAPVNTWATRWLEDCYRDIGFAVRQLRKAPGFTAIAVLSLALGIGANTSIFTLIESALLRPIPVKHPESLRLLTWREQSGGWVAPNLGYRSPTFGTIYEQRETPDGGLMHTDFTPRIYREFERDGNVFESLFAFKELGRATAMVDGNAEAVNCFLVSGEFYRGMQISPVIGRAIGPGDDIRTEGGSVAVISYRYWSRRFDRSPSVIGKQIKLNQVPVTIIGVNPEYFTGIEPGAHFEIWAPLNIDPAVYGYLQHGADFESQPKLSFLDEANAWTIPMLGRLKPGVSDAQAQKELNALFQAQVDANPGPLASFLKEPSKRPRLLLESAARGVDYLTDRYDRLLITVLALAGLVLLIACANVANLLLSKSAVRQREISSRLALGAGRGRIVRQLFAEGLLLAALAGMAGIIFAYWTRNGIPQLLATPWRPSPFAAALDFRALLVSIGITLLTGVLFSLAPIWQSRRMDVNEALKEGSRGTAGISKLRIGRILVALQVALSIFLLVGAGLCVKTFTNLRNLPLGFQPEGILVFSVDMPRLSYGASRSGVLVADLGQRLAAIAGVRSVTFSANREGAAIAIDGRRHDRGFNNYARAMAVGTRFFQTMGIPILSGRAIDDRDRPNGPPAVVVNQEFARHFFEGDNPVGQTFRDLNAAPYQIVGVCADWRAGEFRDPIRPAFYTAFLQQPLPGSVEFQIRVAGDAGGVVRQIRQVVRSMDSNLLVTDIRTKAQEIDNSLSEERLMASLAAAFGALALLLASIGIYGVMAYAVARRTNEVGVRMALGARPGSIASGVFRETLALCGMGAALGIAAVLGASPVLDQFLAPGWAKSFAYGLKPDDPGVIAVAVLVLVSAGLLAGYVPARRAASIDPMAALRHE